MFRGWSNFDSFVYHTNRHIRNLFRRGNGRIRVALACIILGYIILYPWLNMQP